METIALHACCAPCAASVAPLLRASGAEPIAYYANPNIHPAMEWLTRLEALQQYAAMVGLEVDFEPEYGLSRFLGTTLGLKGVDRCRRCFTMRLAATAEWAARRGLERFTTTLLVSPYQDRDAVIEAGEEAASQYGVDFVGTDFRAEFRHGQARAKELGLYRQAYCGCVFSEAERYAKRLERKYASRSEPAPP